VLFEGSSYTGPSTSDSVLQASLRERMPDRRLRRRPDT
jgi:hypothetical protein